MKQRITEAQAYRAWHKEQRLRQQWKRDLKRIERDLEALSLDVRAALERQRVHDAAQAEAETRRLVESLPSDRAFMRALNRFWGHTPRGWEAACGCDGRMKALLKTPGWDILREVIRRIRRANGMCD